MQRREGTLLLDGETLLGGWANLYQRFLDAQKEIAEMEAALTEKGRAMQQEEQPGEAAVRIMSEADREVKRLLTRVFGSGNDFDAILGGINLMAVASNGERVITNLMAALVPVIQAGAESCAKQETRQAVDEARANRAAHRAAQNP